MFTPMYQDRPQDRLAFRQGMRKMQHNSGSAADGVDGKRRDKLRRG